MMKSKESFGKFFFLHFEWAAFLLILIAAATIDPASESLFCPLEWMGLENCPGSGIGRSMGSAFRGDFIKSVQLHPAGIPAILILMVRIGSVLNRNRKLTTNHNHDEII
jgi:hypothetical protein